MAAAVAAAEFAKPESLSHETHLLLQTLKDKTQFVSCRTCQLDVCTMAFQQAEPVLAENGYF
jgi:hypothetical protein